MKNKQNKNDKPVSDTIRNKKLLLAFWSRPENIKKAIENGHDSDPELARAILESTLREGEDSIKIHELTEFKANMTGRKKGSGKPARKQFLADVEKDPSLLNRTDGELSIKYQVHRNTISAWRKG